MEEPLQNFVGMGLPGHRGLLHLPQIGRCLFRGGRINIKPCSPLEASDFGQFGHDLNMPMVALPILFGRGRRVENVVVRRIMKDPIQFTKGIGKDLGCQSIVRRIHLLKAGEMGLGENPGLKRESRGKRAKD